MVKQFSIALLLTAAFLWIVSAKAEARPLDSNGNSTVVIGSRPPTCPRAYCGCGLRLFLGLKDVRLNLARAWAELFPRTSVRPGAVAVKNHHVFYVEAVVKPGLVLARDYNSGGGLSRLHLRSTKGFVFVQPQVSHASRV